MPATAADFESQVLPLRRDLYAAALRYTRNRADAEDLVQDTLVRAYSAWPRYQPGANLRGWLYRILVNGFISGYRRDKRRRRFADSGDEALRALYGERGAGPADPATELSRRSLGDEVVAALGKLGAEQRRVVELADLAGAQYKEVAAALDLPLGTVMSRLFRARRQLERELGDYAARDYGIRRAAA